MTYQVRTYVKPPALHLSRKGYLKEVVAGVIRQMQKEAQGMSFTPFGLNAKVNYSKEKK